MPSALVVYRNHSLNDYELNKIFKPGLGKQGYRVRHIHKIGRDQLICIESVEDIVKDHVEKVLIKIKKSAERKDKYWHKKKKGITPFFTFKFDPYTEDRGHGFEIIGSYDEKSFASQLYVNEALLLMTDSLGKKVDKIAEDISNLGKSLSSVS